MNGIELAARFSYITNSLRFCGPVEANKQFLEYFDRKENEKDVVESLKKFEGLLPYLSSIAFKNNKENFDYDVVEAYWIGNNLLDHFNIDDMKNVIRKLTMRGLPKSFGEKLIQKMPNGFFPHHNFNVFFVGVGMLTRSVETNLENMNNCRVSSGRVLEFFDNSLIVETDSVKESNGKYFFGEKEIKTVVYMKEMIKGIKINDYVALHWGFATMVLNESQINNLMKYSQKILDVMNG